MIYFIPFLFCILHSRYIESIFYICAILSSIIRYSYRKPYGEYMIYSNRLYNLIDFTGGELRFIMSVYILVDTFLNTIFTYGLYYEISLAYFMKNDFKSEASLDPFWVPWAPLGSISEPPGHKLCQKWLEVEICGLRGNDCFPMVKRYILRVWGAGVLQMGTFGRTWEAPGAQSGAPGAPCGHANFESDF